ncbi:DUF4937 domain-containing protein [Bacillus sonorensis]|nr:DUF4937 domain-containing protein [Bacillus sonorensis]
MKGFVRQWGGWLEAEEGPEAVIMALWKTKQDYMNFMKNDHDLIYETTNQKDTFHSSHIELIEDPAEIGRALKRHSLNPCPGMDGRLQGVISVDHPECSPGSFVNVLFLFTLFRRGM